MKYILGLAAAAVIGAGQASALSCIRPDVAQAFNWAAASDDSYIVLLGEFSFGAPPPRGGTALIPEDISMPAEFEGQFLGPEGFAPAPAFNLTLTFSCMASWCGSLSHNAGETLAFVRQTPQGYTLDVDPCYGLVFPGVNDVNVGRVEACMRGEGCDAGPVLP